MAEQAKVAAQEAPVAEKQTNCLSCNKPIKKIRRYYRDGKYYCIKKCWKDYLAKSKEGSKE